MEGYLANPESLSDSALVSWHRNFKRQPPTMDLMREFAWAGQIAREIRSRKLSGCDGVCRDGIYHGAGRVENGKFIGFTGKCFRCDGKSFQTESDRNRNRTYDNHYRRIAA